MRVGRKNGYPWTALVATEVASRWRTAPENLIFVKGMSRNQFLD